MALIDTTRSLPLGAVTTHKIITFFDHLRETFVLRRNAAKTEKELRHLTDAQLRDIGLVSAQIPAVSWSTFSH